MVLYFALWGRICVGTMVGMERCFVDFRFFCVGFKLMHLLPLTRSLGGKDLLFIVGS